MVKIHVNFFYQNNLLNYQENHKLFDFPIYIMKLKITSVPAICKIVFKSSSILSEPIFNKFYK